MKLPWFYAFEETLTIYENAKRFAEMKILAKEPWYEYLPLLKSARNGVKKLEIKTPYYEYAGFEQVMKAGMEIEMSKLESLKVEIKALNHGIA